MLLYPVLHMLVFTLYINFDTIALCFQRFNFSTGQTEFSGLYWFKRFFEELGQSYALRRSFTNSLWFIPVTNFILLPLSILAAFFLFKKVPFSRMYRVVFFIPSIISIVIMTMCFSFMFDSTFGVVNDLLGKMGLESLQRTWLGDPGTRHADGSFCTASGPVSASTWCCWAARWGASRRMLSNTAGWRGWGCGRS